MGFASIKSKSSYGSESGITINSARTKYSWLLLVAAFNAQDSDAMASLVADDIEWLSIVSNDGDNS